MAQFTGHLLYGVGGTVSIQLLNRPETNASVTIYDGSGSVKGTANTACTIEAISTNTNGAVSSGATTVNLTNAAGVTSDAEFWIRTPDEKVRAKTISANTVTLFQPLLYAHSDNVVVESTLISASLNSTYADSVWWDGRVEWRSDGVVVAYSSVECTKYPLDRYATAQDVYDENPKFRAYMDTEFNMEKALDVAHYDILSRIAGIHRVRVYPGCHEFIRATVYRFFVNHYRQIGRQDELAMYESALADELASVSSWVPRDANQDGVVSSGEKISLTSIPVVRV